MTTINPKVIDLYHGDTVTSFEEIYASGIRAIIHKATEGATLTDKAYASRREQALDEGLLWGAYHFLRPGNMKDQARRFVDAAAPTEATLLAADHEDSRVSVLNLQDFLAEIHAETGHLAVIYSGYVIKEQIGAKTNGTLAAHRFWLAQYGPKPKWPTAIWPSLFLWQYTESGSNTGVSGGVDLNSFDGTDEDLAKQWSAT